MLYIQKSNDHLFDIDAIKKKAQQLRMIIDEALHFKETCLNDILKNVETGKEKLEKYFDQLSNTITEWKHKTQAKLDSEA